MIIELIGYIGSIIIVVSMLMTSVIKLRLLNMLGGIIFSVYALMIHSYPTAIMNIVLSIINLVNIHKLMAKEKKYSIVKLNSEDTFLRFFLYQHESDIKIFFPNLEIKRNYDYAYIVCYQSNPVGIFLGMAGEENSIEIKIDYVTPAFRDCSIGSYLYEYISARKGISSLIFKKPTEEHRKYLLRMGFIEKDDSYVKAF